MSGAYNKTFWDVSRILILSGNSNTCLSVGFTKFITGFSSMFFL